MAKKVAKTKEIFDNTECVVNPSEFIAVNEDINYCDALKVLLNSDSLCSKPYSRNIYPSDALSTHSRPTLMQCLFFLL